MVSLAERPGYCLADVDPAAAAGSAVPAAVLLLLRRPRRAPKHARCCWAKVRAPRAPAARAWRRSEGHRSGRQHDPARPGRALIIPDAGPRRKRDGLVLDSERGRGAGP